MEKPKKRVFVVDDHDIVRLGMVQVINKQPDLEICGEASSVSEALPRIRKLRPDIVVTDISLRESNGMELVKTLRAEFPRLVLLILSMHDETIWAEDALRAGASGYLMKESSIDTLVPAIRTILQGRIYVSETVLSRMIHGQLRGKNAHESQVESLSAREKQVLQLIGQWKSTKEIAAELSISVKTVEYYKEQLKEKLSLRTAAELTQYGVSFVRG